MKKVIANVLPLMPQALVWPISKQYIAGKTFDDAVKIVQSLNAEHVYTSLDILGESIEHIDEMESYKQLYLISINEASALGLETTFSVKPTMFGLKLDFKRCYEAIDEVVDFASRKNYRITIDMEDSSCTDDELQLFTHLYESNPQHVRLALQAYLKRTPNDIDYLASIQRRNAPIEIRLCKGIYTEPADIAYQKKDEVRDNFMLCLEKMMAHKFYCAIATHDDVLLTQSLELVRKKQLTNKQYEFQMLYGVKPRLQQQMANQNIPLRIYIPYGKAWFRYATRRIKENPSLVWHIVRSTFLRQ